VGVQGTEKERTHSCRPREHGVAVRPREWTYRFCVIIRDDRGPDDAQHGEVPILQDCQANRDLKHFGTPYGDEQYKYCRIST